MPCDYSRYPADWDQIRQRILDRAVHRCECAGVCGDSHGDQRCPERHGHAADWAKGQEGLPGFPPPSLPTVVLTIAHLDHDVANNADDNLSALCQRCHLRLDQVQHIENSARTRLEQESRTLPGQANLLEALR